MCLCNRLIISNGNILYCIHLCLPRETTFLSANKNTQGGNDHKRSVRPSGGNFQAQFNAVIEHAQALAGSLSFSALSALLITQTFVPLDQYRKLHSRTAENSVP